jgi:hypothetical protein
MAAFKYEQNVVEGREVSEVWGLDNVPDDRKAAVIQEWIQRHTSRAKALGYVHSALTTDPHDSGHYVFKAWTQ